MLNAIQAREEYDLRFHPQNRAVAILRVQYLDTAELQSRIDHARELIEAPKESRIHALLTGLREELAFAIERLQERIGSLSPDHAPLQQSGVESQTFWQLFRTDGSDCSGHMEALLSGYVRYARATSDSLSILQALGDEQSAQLMKRLFDAADRNIWFLEFYMEGLALRVDLERLPRFAPIIGHAETVHRP